MRRGLKNKITCLVLLLLVLVMGADAGGEKQDERTALQERVQTLREKVTSLKREQDFLLFQKEMYAADSKYLVLDIKNMRGKLKYKYRVLRDFRFIPEMNFNNNALQPGMLILTQKMEGKNNRYVLTFESSLIVQWPHSATLQGNVNIPTLLLGEKDIRSVFSAVEEGARAYILR